MAKTQKKSWKNSKNKWTYLKVAIKFLTTPGKVFDIAHKKSSSTLREKAIRSELVRRGVLKFENEQTTTPTFDLDNGHI